MIVSSWLCSSIITIISQNTDGLQKGKARDVPNSEPPKFCKYNAGFFIEWTSKQLCLKGVWDPTPEKIQCFSGYVTSHMLAFWQEGGISICIRNTSSWLVQIKLMMAWVHESIMWPETKGKAISNSFNFSANCVACHMIVIIAWHVTWLSSGCSVIKHQKQPCVSGCESHAPNYIPQQHLARSQRIRSPWLLSQQGILEKTTLGPLILSLKVTKILQTISFHFFFRPPSFSSLLIILVKYQNSYTFRGQKSFLIFFICVLQKSWI